MDLHDYVNFSTLDFYAEATDEATSVIHNSTVVMIAASLSILAATLLIVPFLYAVDRQRDHYIK